MRFFRATNNGISYFAIISESLGGGYAISVDAKLPDSKWYPDWHGKEYGDYAYENSAITAMRRHYPGVEWTEDET